MAKRQAIVRQLGGGGIYVIQLDTNGEVEKAVGPLPWVQVNQALEFGFDGTKAALSIVKRRGVDQFDPPMLEWDDEKENITGSGFLDSREERNISSTTGERFTFGRDY